MMIKNRIKLFIPLNRLFFRILGYFLSLLVPILIIGTVFYFNSTNRIQENYTQKVEMNLRSSIDTIEIYLRTIQDSSANFFSENKDLLRPYDEYSLSDRVRIPEIPATLGRISSNLGVLVDFIFAYADTDKVYLPEGLNDFNFFFDQYYHMNAYDKKYWDNKLMSGAFLEILDVTSRVSQSTSHARKVIPFVFTNTSSGNKVVLVTTVPTDMILKTIQNHAVMDATQVLVTDNRNRVIVSSDQNLSDPSVIEQLHKIFNSTAMSHSEAMIGNKKVVVSRIISESYGWNYYSVTPANEFNKDTSYFVASIMVICFTLILIGIIFSFIFAYNLYSPIKRFRDILSDTNEITDEVNNETGKYNEFDYIGKRINSLIERNHKIQSKLETQSAEYLKECLINLFRGMKSKNGQEEIWKMLRNDMMFLKPMYQCFAIRFYFKEPFYNEVQDVDRMNILSKMGNLIGGLLRSYVDVYLLEEKENLYIGIFNLNDREETNQLKKALQKIIDTFQYDSRYCLIRIGIGKEYQDVLGISQSYSDAMNALESSDVKADFQIIDAGTLSDELMHVSYSFSDENSIINCLKAGDKENLQIKVEEIIKKNKEKHLPRHLITNLLKEMYNTGCRFLIERGLIPHNIAGNETLFKGDDNEEKKVNLLLFFDTIIEQTTSRNRDTSNEISSVIIKYIEENYHSDLGLEKIAEGMGVSAKYISRIFKEKTGINLVGYISWYRISKAKELLVETDLTINEIVDRVGIYSRTTFIRLFKKYEGTTPNLFRNSNRNNKAL
ncbi:helix-turn-helix domain-containing protein [Paenibacillus sp. GCM10023248]|uniref:helix-turn-helix domain-containing protein n=1 Tax=unclassified Paenibacillus TaxID=185978 RepID=UPI002378A5C8|nr:helix-turn-helix domain-containing protein [Paenibacillus sp. MAHUQ-63]MDD9269572.1 helix-turn-helix domain-containing protein [Paenibacillus sp. MAHUQ-63]